MSEVLSVSEGKSEVRGQKSEVMKNRPKLLIANNKGKIYSLKEFEPVAMKAGHFFRLDAKDLIKLPYGSEIFMLAARNAVGYDFKNSSFTALDNFAVAAFVAPGYTITHNSAYIQQKNAKVLPLFSYGAVCFYKNDFYTAAVRVDRERRQDLRLMDINLVKKNVNKIKKLFPHNRLIRHLQNCALVYGCPAGKNFFLKRYEAPLPSSPYCNSRCIGCISYQPDKKCPVTQPRIKFIPTPQEIAEVALFHIENVKDPVVSFGQGCEGEPLLVAGILKEAIRLIRKNTKKGIINLNTNASRPKDAAALFDTGLDSIRVSLNSAQERYYLRYYKPVGYKFSDIIKSIKTAKEKKGFVSINYLIQPGFSDSAAEFSALKAFIAENKIDMIQFRNLNIDPVYYFNSIKFSIKREGLLGVRESIALIKKEFPYVMTGYFNPSLRRIKDR